MAKLVLSKMFVNGQLGLKKYARVLREAAEPALPQRLDQRAFLDEQRTAGVDDQRRVLHASKVSGGDDPVGFRLVANMEADDVRVFKKHFPACRHLVKADGAEVLGAFERSKAAGDLLFATNQRGGQDP